MVYFFMPQGGGHLRLAPLGYAPCTSPKLTPPPLGSLFLALYKSKNKGS